MDLTTQQIRLGQWAEIIKECNESPLTNREWCIQNGINEKQYYYWQRKVRNAVVQQIQETTTTSSVTFAELPMAKTDTLNETESTILEATTIRLHKGEFCIELTNQADDKLLTFIRELMLHA